MHRTRPLRALLGELRRWPTLALVVVVVLVGVPAAIALTPAQPVVVLGQHVRVGAQDPTATVTGPARLVQVGNSDLDIQSLRVVGPMRPELTLGPVRRGDAAAAALGPADVRERAATSLGGGFLRWYGLAGLALLAFTLAATAIAGCARLLGVLRRQQHHGGVGAAGPVPHDLWRRSVQLVGRMTVLAVTAAVLAWGASGALAYAGAVRGLQGVSSLSDLVGDYALTPAPVGPELRGYDGAVIGDSRAARAGGPRPAGADADAVACGRSTDSLAAQVGQLLPARVLNLSCTGASVEDGLRGAQDVGGTRVASQVGRLKQVRGLDFVVVVVGPNDLHWADFLRYCYGLEDCSDNLVQGEFAYRLTAFEVSYGRLLTDLAELPDEPRVVVVESYDAFAPGADAGCADARGPAGAAGLDPDDVELLAARNDQLNRVLRAGAEDRGFTVADPQLVPLCAPAAAALGPDLQGLDDSHPFHPTGAGSVRLAASVVRALDGAD